MRSKKNNTIKNDKIRVWSVNKRYRRSGFELVTRLALSLHFHYWTCTVLVFFHMFLTSSVLLISLLNLTFLVIFFFIVWLSKNNYCVEGWLCSQFRQMNSIFIYIIILKFILTQIFIRSVLFWSENFNRI